MSTRMYGCHPNRPCRHGPTPAVIYVAHLEGPENGDAFAQSCQNFVRNRGWPHVATVRETDLDSTLESREGWERVLACTAAGAEIIVVPSSAHLNLSEEEFGALKADLRQREILLVAVH